MIAYILALAGLAALACSPSENPYAQPKILPPKKPEDEPLGENFGDDMEARERYLKLKVLGVKDSELDLGCSYFRYEEDRTRIEHLGKNDRKPLQACEVDEYILNHSNDPRFKPLAHELAGGSIPWDLDDDDDQTTDDVLIRKQFQDVIADLHVELSKKGLNPKNPAYQEGMALGLMTYVAIPSGGVDQFHQKRTLSPLEQSLYDKDIENLKKEMFDRGLIKIWEKREKTGGIRIRGGNYEVEFSALQALRVHEGDCTENSKILFGAMHMAGLDPVFNFVNLWESSERRVQEMIRENPNTYHINIGLRIGDRIRLLEPTNLIPSEVKSGPLLLSLRQYLALDLTNHAVASRNKDAQQAKDLLIRARRLDPSSIFPLPNLASALTGLNETDKALEVLDSSLKLNPNAAISYFMKGIIFHKQGKKEEAMAAYSRSLELNGSDYEIYLYRGDLFQWMEKYKDGDRDYTNALRLAPNNAGKKLTEHVSDILTKKWEDPSTKKIHIQILNETKMEPVYVETLFYLASLYWRANQEEFTFDLLKEFAQHLRPVRNSLKLKNQEFSPEVLKFLENLYQLFPPALWQRYEIKPLWDSLELPFK